MFGEQHTIHEVAKKAGQLNEVMLGIELRCSKTDLRKLS